MPGDHGAEHALVAAELAGDVLLLGREQERDHERAGDVAEVGGAASHIGLRSGRRRPSAAGRREAARSPGSRTGTPARISAPASSPWSATRAAERLDLGVERRPRPRPARSTPRTRTRARRRPCPGPKRPRAQRRPAAVGAGAGRRAVRGRRRRRRLAGGRGRRSRAEMLLDLGERPYLALAAARRRGRSAAPRSRRRAAPATSSSGVSPTCSASLRLAAGELERRGEDRRVGLARARAAAEVTTPSSSVAEAAALEHLRQRVVPVGDADQRRPRAAQAGQRRRGVRVGAKADRGHHRLDADLAARARGRAARRSGARRSASAPGRVGLVGVVAVVGHLGAPRGDRRRRRRARSSRA